MPNEPRGDGPANTALGPGGEFDLIRVMLTRWGDIARGVGDDAAVLDVRAGEQVVVSTDTSVEDVHFRRAWFTPAEIGYRATVAAISDLAAMAARPLGLVLALTLPEEWRDAVPELADGIGDACTAHDLPIVGGDVTRGAALSLTVTVLGGARAPLRRSTARPGDAVYVTGLLGGPAAALRALERGDSPPAPHLRDRFARPRARTREALWLASHGASAMIDVSDGLSSELHHLAHASAVEIRLDIDRIPVLRGATAVDALRGGEEYELVLTTPHELDVDEFARTFALPLSAIGWVRPAEAPRVSAYRGSESVDLGRGHDHFSP